MYMISLRITNNNTDVVEGTGKIVYCIWKTSIWEAGRCFHVHVLTRLANARRINSLPLERRLCAIPVNAVDPRHQHTYNNVVSENNSSKAQRTW